MNEVKFCKHCGSKIPVDAVICTVCGRQVEALNTDSPSAPAPQIIINNDNTNQNVNHTSSSASLNIGGSRRTGRKKVNRSTALFLCIIGGYLGLHKFYEGNILMGIVYACTGGLFLIGWIVDILSISKKPKTYYV